MTRKFLWLTAFCISISVASLQAQMTIGSTAAPTAGTTLDVRGKVRIADGSQASGKLLTADANGIGSWQTAATLPGINMASSAMCLYNNSAQTGVLSGKTFGDAASLTNFKTLFNNISGASLSGSTVTLPAGTYFFNVSIEVSDIQNTSYTASSLIHSYFIDFPGGVRIHATAATVPTYNLGNHAVQWFTTVALASTTNWTIQLGRGQSGNYFSGSSAGTSLTGAITVSPSSRIYISKVL
ncbi:MULTISPECIES: hypothetical protein [Chitinophagaceae]